MEREQAILIDTITRAGSRALELATRGFDVLTKKDRSPVTTADLEVNRILHEMQREHFPDDGWLSEESPDDAGRLGKHRVWVVDPIDGTKAYVERLPEYCISVALVEEDKPVLAAIFNPSSDELFTAIRDHGLVLNGKPISPILQRETAPLLGVNPRDFRNGRWSRLGARFNCRPMHSIANSLALVSAGRLHAALTIEPQNEWDLAAGVLLIQESRGIVTDALGKPFTFNHSDPRCLGVIAVAATAEQDLHQFLQFHADKARTMGKH